MLEQSKSKSFVHDLPITEEDNDEQNFKHYANALVVKIQNSYFDTAFAVGITGRWGCGKSSFLNLVRKKLTNEDIIQIEFNPWDSSSTSELINNFFEITQKHLAPYHSTISKLISSYSKKLVYIQENTLTRSMEIITKSFFNSDSVNTLYSEIDVAIKKINRKIIIYIDDLDRLDQLEIIETIKLMRNTANFANTFFIVAYDRGYVLNALKDYNGYNYEGFLEKVFQIELHLPTVKSLVFNKKLIEILCEKMPDKINDIKACLDENDIISPIQIDNWIESFRDIQRLVNAITLNFSQLNGEVLFRDFLQLEILRMKNPSVYDFLFKRYYLIFTAEKSPNGKHFYKLKEEPIKTGSTIKKELERLLIENNLVSKENVSDTIAFIKQIFPDYVYASDTASNLSVKYPDKFFIYRAYAVPNDDLSETELHEALSNDLILIKEKINDWIKRGLAIIVRERFYNINKFEDSDDFIKKISAIFFLASSKPKLDENFLGIIGFDHTNLYDKIIHYFNSISDKQEKEKIIGSITKILKDATSPSLFEAGFIHSITSRDYYDFFIDIDEIKHIGIDYIKKYSKQIEKFDKYFWNLFYSTWYLTIETYGNQVSKQQKYLPHGVAETVKELIKKDYDGFILSIIESDHHSKNKYKVKELAFYLYGNWEIFTINLQLISNEQSKYIDEFRTFVKELQARKFSEFIEFRFQKIPIHLSSQYH